MTFIQTIPTGEATDAVRDMYEHQRNHWGYVPNYARVFSHRPEALARWGRLLTELRRPVSDRRFELVTFAAAVELRNQSCSLAHGRLLAHIIGQENVVALLKGQSPEVLSEGELAMMEYARQISRDASLVDSELVAELKNLHGFTDEELFDIAAIAAGRAFFTKLLDALGCEPDAALLEANTKLTQVVADTSLNAVVSDS